MMGILELTTSIFCILLFGSAIFFLSYRKEGLLITPINVLILPYMLLALLVNLVGTHFGYFPIQLKSILFVIGCAIFFGTGGIFIRTFFNADYELELAKKLPEVIDKYKSIFVIIGIISIIAGFVHFFKALNEVGGWSAIATKQFEDAYGKGILAHIAALNRPAFLFLATYFLTKKRISIFLVLLLMFVTVLLLQIKNNIITLLVAAFYFAYIFNAVKINVKKTIIFSVTIFVIFNVSYLIGFSRIGLSNAYTSKVQEYLTHLFFSYLFGGPIGTSEIFNYAAYPLYSYKEIFAIPINLYNVLVLGSSDVIDIVIKDWIPISTNYRYFHTTNVYGLFGMLYAYVGVIGTFIYMFFLGMFSYFIKFLAYKKNAFVGFQLVYAFFLSYLTLGFFGLFFNIIVVVEVMVMMCLIPLISDSFNLAREILMFQK